MTVATLDEQPFGGDDHEGRRWLICAAIVLAVHVGAVAILAERIHITPLPEPIPPAVMIDMAPLPTPAPAPPPPEMEVAKPLETPKPMEMPRPEEMQRPVDPPPEPPRPMELQPPEPIPELPPEPEMPPTVSDVVIPTPKPPPPPPPPKRVVARKVETPPPPPPPQPVQQQPVQPMPQALPSPPAPPAPTPPAPAPAPPMPSNSAAKENYFGKLLAHLSRHKRYPRAALSMRHQGVVMLRFTLDRGGAVTAMRIERSSGFESLDNEVLQLMERAQPLPGMPEEIPGERLEVVVPIQFFLR